MKPKTEVYSWRLAPDVKQRLAEAARREGRSVAGLLDEIVTRDLERRDARRSDDEQARLHARVARYAGSLAGTDADRAGAVRDRVRRRLRRRHDR